MGENKLIKKINRLEMKMIRDNKDENMPFQINGQHYCTLKLEREMIILKHSGYLYRCW